MRLATGRSTPWVARRLDEVGVVVTANYYSLGGPTLAHRLVEHYGLRSDTDKYHVVGVGCASAVPLLRLASQALRDRPGEKALVVAAESVSGFLSPAAAGRRQGQGRAGSPCSPTERLPPCSRCEPAGRGSGSAPSILATEVHQVPGTLDHVRFAVGGDGQSHADGARVAGAGGDGRAGARRMRSWSGTTPTWA